MEELQFLLHLEIQVTVDVVIWAAIVAFNTCAKDFWHMPTIERLSAVLQYPIAIEIEQGTERGSDVQLLIPDEHRY